MKNNFTQAFKELTGFDISTPDETEKTTGFSANDIKEEPVTFHAEETASQVVTYKEFADQTSANCTRITGTMIIKGDIKSDDNIHVNGQVVGEIRTSSNVTSTNLIIGDVFAQEARLDGARLKGNVDLKGGFRLGDNSVVVGNVACDQLSVSGKIKGNCDVNGSAAFDEKAYLLGDITAADLSTQQGAKIVGTIRVASEDPDIDTDFDFGGEF